MRFKDRGEFFFFFERNGFESSVGLVLELLEKKEKSIEIEVELRDSGCEGYSGLRNSLKNGESCGEPLNLGITDDTHIINSQFFSSVQPGHFIRE